MLDAASTLNDSHENCMKEVSNVMESHCPRSMRLGSSPVVVSDEHASSDGSAYHMQLQQATVIIWFAQAEAHLEGMSRLIELGLTC